MLIFQYPTFQQIHIIQQLTWNQTTEVAVTEAATATPKATPAVVVVVMAHMEEVLAAMAVVPVLLGATECQILAPAWRRKVGVCFATTDIIDYP